MASISNDKTEDFTAVLKLAGTPATVSVLFASLTSANAGRVRPNDPAVGCTLAVSFGDHDPNAARVGASVSTPVIWEPAGTPRRLMTTEQFMAGIEAFATTGTGTLFGA